MTGNKPKSGRATSPHGEAAPSTSIIKHLSSIPDPRLNRRKRHKLGDVFFIALCASICGANDWVAVETFGKAKQVWFTELLDLENGIPSHDTFGNVFAVIDTQMFSEHFSRWLTDLTELSGENIILS